MDMKNLLSKIDGLLAEDNSFSNLNEAPDDVHTCDTCERPMPNWEPGDSHTCDECEEGMSPEDSNPDVDDLDEGFNNEEEEYNFNNGDRVRVKDAGPQSEVFTLSQYEPGARRAWIGDEQGRGWYISPSRLEKAEDIESNDYDYEDDDLDEASLTKNELYGQMKKTSNPSNYEPEISDEPVDDFAFDDHDTAHPEVEDDASCWGCGQDWRENWSSEDLGTGEGYEQHGLEPEDRICPDCAEELTGGELNEAEMCEDCGASPCVCEDPLAEAKAKNYYAIATAAIKKKYKLGNGKVDLTDEQTAEAHKLAKKLKKEAKKLDESEEVDESKECDCEGPCSCKKTSIDEMRQLAGLTECGEMWVEPIAQEPASDLQKSKMTVTTSMDSEAGTKQVTVTAEGDGADELMKVLQMAGINIVPTGTSMVDEELANEPDPQTLDSKSMLIDLSGGPNRPQAMTKHGYHQGDNPYAMVEEAVDSLAARLKAQFKSQR